MTLPLTVEFGDIDIYLFDQLLRGRIRQGARVLDAGCGGGRNLVYLLRQGYDVIGADADPAAVDHVRRLAASLAPALPATSFVVAQTAPTNTPPSANPPPTDTPPADASAVDPAMHPRTSNMPALNHPGRMTPMPKLPPVILVKAIQSPRGDHTGVA